jgi:acetoacetyl-CoA synthetase
MPHPDEPLWRPSATRVAGTQLTGFHAATSAIAGRRLADYAALHDWSVREAPAFWALLWDWAGIVGDRGERLVVDRDRMPGARFLPDARLNITENLLGGDDTAVAIIATSESHRDVRLTFRELRRDVARAAAALRAEGVSPGDRVAGIVSNVPEAVIAALATMAIGAVWSSCSPDFGVDGIVDRFGQIEPAVLVAMDGYDYGGKRFDCRQKVTEVVARLPTVRRVVGVPYADPAPANTGATSLSSVSWLDWLGPSKPQPLVFERFPFNHPVYILYSSGTTGVPKCIVHGAGGTLLQHVKEHRLHYDVKAGDRVFYFTTCGWMMWNWLVTALASRAAIVLYDGSPFQPDAHRLFGLADDAGVTLFGVSAKFIDAVRKSGIEPASAHRLSTVRTITSTGSPLLPESFEFVYAAVKRDVHLASLSGGTDIVSCFTGGNPNGPVWRGEMQAAGLGMDVQVFDEHGEALRDVPGELVCATPFPAMPVGFWRDVDGAGYRRSYFERFPNVWWHGDWTTHTRHDGFIIHGRSDTTLKPGGVRIGTAEIYRQVEQFPEILESVAVGQPWEGDERIILFVRLAPGYTLDDELRRRVSERLRRHASPRHVPARIIAVPDVPRTRSGKLVEVAVRRVVQGLPVPNLEALANPESLEVFRDHPELR